MGELLIADCRLLIEIENRQSKIGNSALALLRGLLPQGRSLLLGLEGLQQTGAAGKQALYFHLHVSSYNRGVNPSKG
jgi:hypothetical protein